MERKGKLPRKSMMEEKMRKKGGVQKLQKGRGSQKERRYNTGQQGKTGERPTTMCEQ